VRTLPGLRLHQLLLALPPTMSWDDTKQAVEIKKAIGAVRGSSQPISQKLVKDVEALAIKHAKVCGVCYS
jgi:hypothetical protein